MSGLERQLHAVAQLSQAGKHTDAAAKLRSLLRAHPHSYEVHAWLACELAHLQQLDQAEFFATKAVSMRPDFPGSAVTLANIHLARQRLDRAAEVLTVAHTRHPQSLDVSLGLLGVLDRLTRSDDIVRIARASIAAGFDDPETSVFLGVALFELGRADHAGEAFDRAVVRFPDYQRLLSLRAAVALYRDDLTPAAVAQAARDYGLSLERTIPVGPAPAPPEPRAGRRTRIGFISADFRRHACGYFYAGLLPGFDRKRYEVRVYHHSPQEDEITQWLRERVDALINTSALDNNALLAQLRGDRLDILIEGSGHTHGHVLDVLHRRAAPIQASWMGYPGSTGVAAIDFRISDAVVDPPERDGEIIERPIRMPGCSFAFCPVDPWPDAAAVARESTDGPITFGSFNAIKKITATTISLWSDLLKAVPEARLILIGRGLDSPQARTALTSRFVEQGADPNRLDIRPPVKTAAELRTHYRHIDVALDPFPYHGTTTTCESLMLGVPVLTLQGDTHPARVGGSLLKAIDLADFACDTRAEFVTRGLELATPAGRARLAILRTALPLRFRSTLGDQRGSARRFESAIEEMLAIRA